MNKIIKQAVAPQTQPILKDAFDIIDNTEIRWLSSAGIMINSHGTVIMIDPLLEGFDLPLLVDMPIKSSDVPNLDGVLITHCDNIILVELHVKIFLRYVRNIMDPIM